MQRVIQGRSATLYQTFYDDGSPVDPTGTPTVTIVRADGSVVVQDASATSEGSGKFSYTLTPTQTAALDTLSVTWTADISGQNQTFRDTVEVAGGFVFGIAQAQLLPAFQGLTADQVADARAYAEDILEGQLGYALVPRYSRETIYGDGGRLLRVGKAFIRAVESVYQDTVAWSDTQLTGVSVDGSFLHGTSRWCHGSGYTIGYTHGLDGPPAGAVRAALALAADSLPAASGIDPRVESIVTVDGTLRFSGSGVGLPAVDAYIDANRLPSV
jgi:hypothetical protein